MGKGKNDRGFYRGKPQIEKKADVG